LWLPVIYSLLLRCNWWDEIEKKCKDFSWKNTDKSGIISIHKDDLSILCDSIIPIIDNINRSNFQELIIDTWKEIRESMKNAYEQKNR
jgi:hypothetical protein